MLSFRQHTTRTVGTKVDVKLVELNEADHAHLLVAYAATSAIATLVQRLTGRTAGALRREYTGICARSRMRAHLWSPSYLAAPYGAHRR